MLNSSLGPVADFEPGFGLALTYDTAGKLYVGTSNGISVYPPQYPLPLGGPPGFAALHPFRIGRRHHT